MRSEEWPNQMLTQLWDCLKRAVVKLKVFMGFKAMKSIGELLQIFQDLSTIFQVQ